MVLRKLTLSEWFLRYQLLKFQKHHFYLPFEMDIDVTALDQAFFEQNQRLPITALMVKAAALLQSKAPYSHRVVFPTLLGPRILQLDEPIVNLPILIREKDRDVLSAISIQKADQKTIQEIALEIKMAFARPLSSYPIVNFVSNHKNNWFNRILLRGLYFMAYCMPQNYIKRKGGGICVSSLYNNHSEHFHLRPYAFGPTAITLCFSSLENRLSRKILKLGIGYDHTALGGNEVTVALKELSEIFRTILVPEVPFEKPKAFADKEL